MAKKTRRRKRSTSEKIMVVLGILIALSMLVSLIAGLGSSGNNTNAPLFEDERVEEIYIEPSYREPLSAIDGGLPAMAYLPAAQAM
jgi:hypothetical protein